MQPTPTDLLVEFMQTQGLEVLNTQKEAISPNGDAYDVYITIEKRPLTEDDVDYGDLE